jgi:carbon monoxide dehydrogenase subunit G
VYPEERFRLLVNGAGRLGRVQANADVVLHSKGEHSDVDVTIRAGLSGLLGRSAPVASAFGGSLIEQFFRCLGNRLQHAASSPIC